jgi:hypothetical protein
VPDRDQPNPTVSPADRITQRSKLLRLNFVCDYRKLNIHIGGRAIDQLNQTKVCGPSDVNHRVSP